MVDITGTTNGLNVKRTGTANYHWTYGIIGTSDVTASCNVGIRGRVTHHHRLTPEGHGVYLDWQEIPHRVTTMEYLGQSMVLKMAPELWELLEIIRM